MYLISWRLRAQLRSRYGAWSRRTRRTRRYQALNHRSRYQWNLERAIIRIHDQILRECNGGE